MGSRICGGALLPLAILILMVTTYTRSPAVNRRCVRGLALVLLAWTLLLLSSWTLGSETVFVSVLASLVGLVLVTVGAVLAVIGLIECRRGRCAPRAWGVRSGRWSAAAFTSWSSSSA